jgi:hypothetical protein
VEQTKFLVENAAGLYELFSVHETSGSLYVVNVQNEETISVYDNGQFLGESLGFWLNSDEDRRFPSAAFNKMSLQALGSSNNLISPNTYSVVPIFAQTYPVFTNQTARPDSSKIRTIKLCTVGLLGTLISVVLAAGKAASLPRIADLTLTLTSFRDINVAIYSGYLSIPAGQSSGITIQAITTDTAHSHQSDKDVLLEAPEHAKFIDYVNAMVLQSRAEMIEKVTTQIPKDFHDMILRHSVSCFDSFETLVRTNHKGIGGRHSEYSSRANAYG